MSLDMYGPMSRAAAWMMTENWDAFHLLLLWAMWVVMMVGMMLPSLFPVMVRHRDGANSFSHTSAAGLAFLGGYVAVWVGFATVATVAHRVLSASSLVTPMMEAASPWIAGIILLLAGLYQLTPWKRACLGSCCRIAAGADQGAARPPHGFIAGVTNGLGCVGCCWALMLLLFAGGVMKLWLNLALTGVILAEKIGGPATRVPQLLGVLLTGLGLFLFTR
jgi:predicted metal-binding membrane protein